MNSNDYIEVSLFFEPFSEGRAEIVEAELSELPYDSFMISEEEGLQPCLKAYIQQERYDARALKLALSGLDFEVSFKADLMPAKNWNADWESRFSPIVIGRDVTVKAPHHTGLRRTRFNITIDPQMAFGTGHHQTTWMMMSVMMENIGAIRGKVVMDMGCGTGVLGILAAKMGAEHVYGIDIDAVAAESAFWNAHTNRVARKFETYCGDASLLQMGKYDVLLANIHRNIIIMDLRTYARSLRAGGLLFTSGFYVSDCPAIEEEAARQGLSLIKSCSREEWACLLFKKN